MAKEFPPYTSSTGLLKQLFQKIKEATPPQRFSQDFLLTSLKFKKSGATLSFIPMLKRLGFLGTDGVPSDIYKKFRNPDVKISGAAMAQALRTGYSDLFLRNEYWYKKDKNDLKNFLIEVLEADPKDIKLNFLLATIEALKTLSDFEEKFESAPPTKGKDDPKVDDSGKNKDSNNNGNDIEGINLSYTINLNLPETSDIAVFNAIFKSLKENLLKK
jgi:hypothetical protein